MLAHSRRLSTRVSAPPSALARVALAPASQRLITGLSPRSSPQSPRQLLPSTPRAPLSLRICAIPLAPSRAPLAPLHVRFYSRRSGRNPWESGGGSGDWMSTVKTGALLAVGAGAVVAAASVGFGFIVFGAAGYGLYSLYQRFFAPYRSNDPFGSVQADIDRIFNQSRQRSRSGTTARGGSPAGTDQDLDSLVQGLPFMVRGLVKTLFSFAGSAMKSSMARAGELRRLANDAMRANTAIVSQMGNDVSISTPQNWMEYTVNGAGRVEAVLPVIGDGYAQAQVTAKASVGVNGELTLQELKYRNQRTGEVIDLLRDGGAAARARRKRVVEAEYVDLDDRK